MFWKKALAVLGLVTHLFVVSGCSVGSNEDYVAGEEESDFAWDLNPDGSRKLEKYNEALNALAPFFEENKGQEAGDFDYYYNDAAGGIYFGKDYVMHEKSYSLGDGVVEDA